MTNPFMRSPCSACPFRVGASATSGINRRTAQQIADRIEGGKIRPCVRKMRTAEKNPGAGMRWCSGAAGTLENEGKAATHPTIGKVSEMGLIDDLSDIDRSNLYPDMDTWVAAHPTTGGIAP